MKTNLLVSIIIPMYNRERLIGQTLESILSQTSEHWECILIDDGSTDSSLEVGREFEKRDSRIRVYERPAQMKPGGNASRNFGYEKSSGDYVNWFDSDDIMAPDFIRLKLELLESDETLDAVISKRAVFSGNPSNVISYEHRTELTTDIFSDFFLIKTTFFLQDVMWRKSFLADKDLFNEDLLSGQDRDFHIRMLLENPKLSLCDAFLTFYRWHEDNITNNIQRSQRLKVSHLHGMNELFRLVDKKGRLSNEGKAFYFKRMMYYLPNVLESKDNLKVLISVLKLLSVRDWYTFRLWVKFYASLVSYRITGRGYELLK